MNAELEEARALEPGSWAGRRVTVVADYDSFLRAASAFAANLERLGATIRYRLVFARPGQISRAQLEGMGLRPEQVRTLPMELLVTQRELGDEDVVVLGLSGLRTRRFIVRLHRVFEHAMRRPLVVSLYPGLIFRFHLEGMMSRMGADLLLLNSPADLRLYEGALAEMGLENTNAICAGLSFLPPARPPRIEAELGDAILFVAQPTVPASREERRYVLIRLLELARRYPDHRWLIKPRHRRNETTMHRDDHHYEDLLDEVARREALPPNLQVVHEPLRELFEQTRLCLTFSSTAALEAVQLGIPTRVLTDAGIHENIGNHFFIGSGLLCTLDHVEPETGWLAPDPAWWSDNVGDRGQINVAIARLQVLLAEQGRRARPLPPPYARLTGKSNECERYLWSRPRDMDTGWSRLVRQMRSGRARVIRLARERISSFYEQMMDVPYTRIRRVKTCGIPSAPASESIDTHELEIDA